MPDGSWPVGGLLEIQGRVSWDTRFRMLVENGAQIT